MYAFPLFGVHVLNPFPFFLFVFFSKCLEAFPSDCGVWAQFAALEGSVGETERSRAVFELAIRQPVLDMPETLWKAYIDFEVGWVVGRVE